MQEAFTKLACFLTGVFGQSGMGRSVPKMVYNVPCRELSACVCTYDKLLLLFFIEQSSHMILRAWKVLHR